MEPFASPTVKTISRTPTAIPRTLTAVRAGRCSILEKTKLSILFCGLRIIRIRCRLVLRIGKHFFRRFPSGLPEQIDGKTDRDRHINGGVFGKYAEIDADDLTVLAEKRCAGAAFRGAGIMNDPSAVEVGYSTLCRQRHYLKRLSQEIYQVKPRISEA